MSPEESYRHQQRETHRRLRQTSQDEADPFAAGERSERTRSKSNVNTAPQRRAHYDSSMARARPRPQRAPSNEITALHGEGQSGHYDLK